MLVTTTLSVYYLPRLAEIRSAPELKTEIIKAEANVKYNGWYPLIKDPYIEEIGFIPSQAHGNKLAISIAHREERRRNAVQISMPIRSIPEYFKAGCPIVGRVRVYDGDFGFEAIIISMGQDKGEFSFSCGRINQFSPPVPGPIVLPPYIPSGGLQLIASTSITLQTGVVNSIQVSAGGGIA